MRISLHLVSLSSVGILGCSTSSKLPASDQDRAIAALNAIYVDKDLGAIDTYFDKSVIRHDPYASADGTAALKADLAGSFHATGWMYHRAYVQDDLVVLHDEYDDVPAAGATTIGFDLFRFAAGKIAEHWTCRQLDPGAYASGHTMVDGPTELDASVDTTASANVVVTPGLGFVPIVIIGGAFQQVGNYVWPNFTQHDPLIADGLQGLGAGFSAPPLNTLRVVDIPESLAEDQFVFTRSRGTLTWDAQKPNSPNNPTVYCDLFRVENGKIAEHWDVIQLDPNSTNIDSLGTNAAGHTMWE
jgi:predicted SnoaL-like aldol condensation-catalyzing enzyme